MTKTKNNGVKTSINQNCLKIFLKTFKTQSEFCSIILSNSVPISFTNFFLLC